MAKMAKVVEEIILKVSVDDKRVTKGLNRVNKASKRTTKSTDKLGKSLKVIGGAAAIFGLIKLSKAALEVEAAFAKIQNALTTTFGTGAGQQLEFIRNKAHELGIDLIGAGAGFSKFASAAKGAGMEAAGIQELFTGAAEASAALSLSADDTNGVLVAFGQIASKGKVETEDLKQIAEKTIPIFKLASDALGVNISTFRDMLQQGKIASSDLLPKLAAEFRKTYHEGALKFANTELAKSARLQNEFNEKMKDAGGPIRETANHVGIILVDALNWAADASLNLELAANKINGTMDIYADKIDKGAAANSAFADSLGKVAKKAEEVKLSLSDEFWNTFQKLGVAFAREDNLETLRKNLGLTVKGFKIFEKSIVNLREKGANFNKWGDDFKSLRKEIDVFFLDNPLLKDEAFKISVDANSLKDTLIKGFSGAEGFLKGLPLLGKFFGDEGLGAFDEIEKIAASASLGPVEAIESGTARAQAFLARPSDSIEQINKDQLVVQKEQKDILGRIEKNQTVIKVQGL